MSFKEIGVLFVGQVVAGEVVGFEGKAVMQSGEPDIEGLVGDGEHQVEVEGGNARLAQDVEGFGGFVGGVIATKQGEGGLVPGLHAEADAGDAEGTQQGGFGGADRFWVGLETEFLEVGKIKLVAQTGEEGGQVLAAEGGGGAAAEIDGFGAEFQLALVYGQFLEDRFDESGHVGVAGRVFIKAAIGADAMAERDVEVEVLDQGTVNLALLCPACILLVSDE